MLVDLLYPRRCPVCDEPVFLTLEAARLGPKRAYALGEGLACPKCVAKLAPIKEPFCLKCGKALGVDLLSPQAPTTSQEYCGDCLSRSHDFIRGMALFSYQDIAGPIYRFKNKGRREYAGFFGLWMARFLGEEIRRLRPDILLPVPIHRKREKARGYNQATELARVLSRRLDIPYDDELISRVKETKPLKGLNLAERKNNLEKAFKIQRNDVKLKTAVIIDDVFTTGSTVDAMARELHGIGVGSVYFVALSIGKG